MIFQSQHWTILRQSSDFLSNFTAVNWLTTVELKITSLFLLVSSRNMMKTLLVERTRDVPSALCIILYNYKSLLAFFISHIGTHSKCSGRKSVRLEHTYARVFQVLREGTLMENRFHRLAKRTSMYSLLVLAPSRHYPPLLTGETIANSPAASSRDLSKAVSRSEYDRD